MALRQAVGVMIALFAGWGRVGRSSASFGQSHLYGAGAGARRYLSRDL